MMIGAAEITLGLALYGPKLTETAGSEITGLDKTRAYCIALSAGIKVIIATSLSLPVSSTHIAVGVVSGAVFRRECLKRSYTRMVEQTHLHHPGGDEASVRRLPEDFRAADLEGRRVMLQRSREHSAGVGLSKKERRGLKRVCRNEFVKRTAPLRIVIAWIVTVPVSVLLAAILVFMIRGMMPP